MKGSSVIKRLATLSIGLVICFVTLHAPAAPDRGTEEEAMAMVKKAIQYYGKHGRAKALAEIARNPGPFVDRDLYVTVLDMNGTALAHINAKMVGKNLMEIRDTDGKYMVRERIESAQKQSKGWQDYRFFNPVTSRIEPKHLYWERHDNLVFACGAYTVPK
jgi:signal transduction histidine kinase